MGVGEIEGVGVIDIEGVTVGVTVIEGVIEVVGVGVGEGQFSVTDNRLTV